MAPLADATPNEISAEGGLLKLKNGGRQVTYVELLAQSGLSSLQAHGEYNPVDEAKGPKAIFSFSAVFAEVRVDEDLGLVRLNRVVGAYDAGKIKNPITARSQAIGGIIWGTGARRFWSNRRPILGPGPISTATYPATWSRVMPTSLISMSSFARSSIRKQVRSVRRVSANSPRCPSPRPLRMPFITRLANAYVICP
jgi:hypothetical protein